MEIFTNSAEFIGPLRAGFLSYEGGEGYRIYDLPVILGKLDADALLRILISDWNNRILIVMSTDSGCIACFSFIEYTIYEELRTSILYGWSDEMLIEMEQMDASGFSGPDGQYPVP